MPCKNASIGPNAIIQLGETFKRRSNVPGAIKAYAQAGCLKLLDHPPETMVNEQIVADLFSSVSNQMAEIEARDYFTEAGSRTGDYILQHRIPGFARWLLPRLPRWLALRILLHAIQKHAWTFAGSGQFSFKTGHPATISIVKNPISTQMGCAWHAAVFKRIFGSLLRTSVEIKETCCCGMAASACTFEIELHRPLQADCLEAKSAAAATPSALASPVEPVT